MTAALVMVCAPVAGLRVTSCCRCPWQPQYLSPLGHRSLERALVSAPFQPVPLISRPKNKMPLAVFGAGLQNIYFSRRVSQPVPAPLVDARSPSCIVVEFSLLTARFSLCKPRQCGSLARGV